MRHGQLGPYFVPALSCSVSSTGHRNTRHFHSCAVCAELTSAQSLWPVCSTVTASHHTICMSDRRDAGQVLFFPQQHIFQGSPIKMTCQSHVKCFPDTHGLVGNLRSTQMVQVFLTSHLSSWPVKTLWWMRSLQTLHTTPALPPSKMLFMGPGFVILHGPGFLTG